MHSQFPFRLSDGQDRPGSQSKLRRSSRLRYPSSHPLFRFFRKELALLSLFTFVMVALQLRSRVSIFEAYTSAYFETHDIRKSLVTPSLEHRKLAAASYPSYLPISQHLKTLNLTKKKPSLEDMVYGSQRRSLPDLGSTDNRDLKDCLQCTEHAQEVREADIPVKAKFHLAKILIRLFAYYDIASLMTFPCADEIQWLFPVVKIMKVRSMPPSELNTRIAPSR